MGGQKSMVKKPGFVFSLQLMNFFNGVICQNVGEVAGVALEFPAIGSKHRVVVSGLA